MVPNGLNPPKINSNQFTNFAKKQVSVESLDFRFRSLYTLLIQNLSNCGRHKYDLPFSRIFLNLIFGGILTLGPSVPRCEATGEEECTGRKLFLTVTESPLSCLTAAENEMNLS